MLIALHNHPPTLDAPWNIVLYFDEATPADGLTVHDQRKLWAIYWSFKELGAEPLGHEDNWFVASLVRTKVVNQLDGSLSYLVKRILMDYFFND